MREVGFQRGVIEAEASATPGAHVSISTSADDSTSTSAARPSGAGEVERDAALAAVVHRVLDRGALPLRVAAGRLDPHHVGAVVGEQPGGAQPAGLGGAVDHPEPVERTHSGAATEDPHVAGVLALPVEQGFGVAVRDHLDLVVGDAVEHRLGGDLRVREGGVGVGIVGLPQDVVDADLVARPR